MDKNFLKQALVKMQNNLFYVIKNAKSLNGIKKQNGLQAKESFIRSSEFIDQIHQAVKKSFFKQIYVKTRFCEKSISLKSVFSVKMCFP